ncbi:MAG TPA: N-6 DNA methylase [Thermoanaerobaculia bacterium]|nr:N-6 DNA methylase [Thermoanaerobaculia bacterium]
MERDLWAATEMLRGSLTASECKNYVLSFFLLKRLSDRFEEESGILLREGGDAEDRDEHQFFVPPEARWPQLQKAVAGIGEALNRASAMLEELNPALEGVLTGIDFNDPRKLGNARQRDSILGRLVLHFSKIVLRNDNLFESDLLGHVYEHLIERFSSDAEKAGGEFSTPPQVGRLMVEILQPREGMRICDPACGSGGLLIECAGYVNRQGGNRRNLSLYGQEKNQATWILCKMNLLLHGLPDARIAKGDSIRDPKLSEHGELMSFDLVLSNPPAAMPNWGKDVAENDPRRFRFGIPPANRGDYAFLQHMVAILNPRGRMAVVMPQAALSREGAERHIRQGLLESDLIEAVVALPSGIFSATRVAPAIVVINRAKSSNRNGRVLFVDASTYSRTPAKKFHQIKDWEKIVSSIHEFRHEDGFSKIVTLEEIAHQGFYLQAGLYHSKVLSGEQLDRIADIYQGKGRSDLGEGLEELAVLQGRDMGVRRLSIEDLARWPAPRDPTRAIIAQKGDILLQRIGMNPKSMVVGEEFVGALVSDTVYIIRLREEHRLMAAYLVGFLNSAAGQKRLSPSQGAVVPTLNLRVLRALRVPLPSPAALDLFERVRAVEDDLLDRIQRALELRSKLFEAGDAEALESEMRRLDVEAELLRESIVHAEDLDFQIRNFYPHVIAYGYRRLGSVFDDQWLYREQLALLEVFLTFLGSLGIALVTSLPKPSPEIHYLGRLDLEKLWERGASVGQWVNVCRTTAKALEGNANSPAARAFAAMWTTKRARALDRMVEMRNDDAHGRGPQTKRQFRDAVVEFGELLKEALKENLFLLRYPIRLVENLSISWRETGAKLNTLVYKGDHPSLQRQDIWYHSPLAQGHLYLELEPGSWLSLYPLLSVEEAGSERCTYAIDRFDSGRSRVDLKGLGQSQVASSEHSTSVSNDFWTWLNDVVP